MKDLLVALILTAAGVIDLRKRQVTRITKILLISMIPFGFKTTNLWGAIIAIPFFVAAYYGGIGGGDAKAILLLGILLGYERAFVTVCLGCTMFAAVSKVIELVKRQRDLEFPIMPYLAAGYILQLILGVYIT